jgi:hypothetical protein
MAVQITGQTASGSYIANVDANGNLYVTLANSDTGGLAVFGTLSTNNAAPTSNNIGVLPAVASSSAPTYSAGNQVLLSTDLSGNLRTTLAANTSVNLTQLDGTALGAPSNYGTSPGTVAVQGVNAYVTNTVGVTANLTQIDGTALGAPTDWGTAPATSVVVAGVNAELFAGQTALSAAAASTAATASQTSLVVQVSPNQPSALFTGTVPATAPGYTVLIGGIYNSSAPSPSSGQTLPLQLNSAGAVNTNITNSSLAVTATNLSVNVNEWDGTTLGAPSALGTIQTTGNLISANTANFAYNGSAYEALTCNSTTVTSKYAMDNNLLSIKGSVVVAAAAGVQQVGITGNTAATLDSSIAAATAPTNAVATSVVYQTTIPALTAGQAVAAQSDVTGAQFVNIEGRKKTYSTYASFTPAAGVIAVLPGNASTTVRVTRVEVSMSTTGTAALEAISLIKTSAAPSGGTSASMTVVPHDANYAAASSAPLNYTAAPSAGTPVGTIRGVQFNDGSSALPGNQTWLWEFGTRGGASAIVLRGTAQTLEINMGAVVATQTVQVSFEWVEDNS